MKQLLTKAAYSDAVTQRELDNLNIAYQAACEGIVLLENDGALPLATRTVALYGPGASMTIKGGTGSGEVNERHSVTILEGLENRGFTITTKDWIAGFEKAYADGLAAFKAQQKKAVRALKLRNIMEMMFANYQAPAGPAITPSDAAEACIYVVSRQAGEGADRRVEKGDYLFTDLELENIRTCAAAYQKFILIINCGSGMDLSALDEIPGINAVLYICQLGTQGGNAVADVLSGAVSPSGKLADTWAKTYADIPFGEEYSYRNGDLENEAYKEGIYVGYRYFDTFGVAPRYPFGYGLSYSDFSVHSAGVSLEGTTVTVKAAVANAGPCPAKQVAQLYVSAPATLLDKEYQSLAAFGKTRLLAPAETEILTLTFDLRDLASYRTVDACYVLQPGDYILRLGSHSRDTVPVGVLTLRSEIVVSRHQNICTPAAPIAELQAPARPAETVYAGLPHIPVDPAAFATVTYTYDAPPLPDDPRIAALMADMSDADMADIVVGIGMFGGETRFTLPGAVGNTTSKFWDKGLANVTLCDGPAGLRIQKRSVVTKKNQVKALELPLSVFESLPGFVQSFMKGDPNKGELIYQYTTAFPVATALAQSWNLPLMEQVGGAVFAEMEEYGCTYWLAPAVNIHRNPLCGRNFEYFSEDPFLTGAVAAAIVKGVQQKPGYYVTVKHFAANNQEDNRMGVSSNVSERALREIYLRAFERCVRQGGAKAIMTSYNKVNGTYAPNSHDLCTKVLRCEWGFSGVVMTDWFSTNKGQASSALALAAGNDLIMPGGGSFKKEICKAVKSGQISREALQRCCANVIAATLASATQKEYIDKAAH